MEKSNKDSIDKMLFNEKSLFLLNIRDLRDLGRKFGVPSPTTMKKKELIDYILKIVYGEIDVPIRNSCGRPSSHSFDMDKYISKVKNNYDIAEEISRYRVGYDYGEMMVSSPSEAYVDDDNIESRVFYSDGKKCTLRVRQFVESKGDIEVSKEFAEKFNLENLDVVEILEHHGMFKVITINGIKVNDKFQDFEVNGQQIQKGTSQDFYLSTKEEISDTIENIQNKCLESGIKVIVFGEKCYNSKLTDSVAFDFDDDKVLLYKKIMTFIGLCEKAIYESEDVVVVIENVSKVEDIIAIFDDDISVRIKKYFQNMIHNVITLGNIAILFRIENDFIY